MSEDGEVEGVGEVGDVKGVKDGVLDVDGNWKGGEV